MSTLLSLEQISGEIFAARQHWTMFGDFVGCHNWCVYRRKEVISGIWWVEVRDGVKYPTMPRTVAQMSAVLRVGNLVEPLKLGLK